MPIERRPQVARQNINDDHSYSTDQAKENPQRHKKNINKSQVAQSNMI
jgi:hypothetical protein